MNFFFDENIRFLRRTLFLKSQQEFADELGIKRSTLANWESGQSYPNLPELYKLSVYFKISLDSLLLVDLKQSNLKELGNNSLLEDKELVKYLTNQNELKDNIIRTLEEQVELYKKLYNFKK